jgi:hypothetical protein
MLNPGEKPSDKTGPKESEGVAVIDRACAIPISFRPDDTPLTLAEQAARSRLSMGMRDSTNMENFTRPG